MNTPIRIKTFRSKSLQEAYQQIRLEFGSEAEILETRTRKSGLFGRNRIEVTASSATASTSDPLTTDALASADSTTSEPGQPYSSAVEDMQHGELQAEVMERDENGALVHRPSDTQDEGTWESKDLRNTRIERVCAQVYHELCEAGLDRGIIEQWILAARSSDNPTIFDNAWALSAEISAWVQGFVHVAPTLDTHSSKQQTLAFVGPTGVGKTTTLAKLGAYLSMEFGARIGIVQTDARLAERDPLLGYYAEMLGWELRTANSEEELRASRHELRDCRYVLVDTQGYSPTDEQGLNQLAGTISEVAPTGTYLLMSSTSSERAFLRCEQAFSQFKPDSLVLTKLDESGGLGPLFACLQSCSIPVSFMTDGKHVPANLIRATNSRLARQILGTADIH